VIVVDVCAPRPGVAYDSATPQDLDETVRQVEKTGRRVIAGGGSVILIERALPVRERPR
jgi:hypothetical protein